MTPAEFFLWSLSITGSLSLFAIAYGVIRAMVGPWNEKPGAPRKRIDLDKQNGNQR